MKTFDDVAAWCDGAVAAYGDPSVPVCQLFFRWQKDMELIASSDDGTLVCGRVLGDIVLVLAPSAQLPLPVRTGAPDVTDEEVITYGAVRVVEGVWAITPSLNIDGVIHGFVALYDVPDPAPWDQRIVLP